MYNSIVFSIFTELCSHHRNVILEHFHHTLPSTPQKPLIPMSSHLGEIFLTGRGCHVLFFQDLTSQTLRRGLRDFSPTS